VLADMPGRSYRPVARGKAWVEAGAGFALGDHDVRFLSAVHEAGSIRAGADRVGWSYRHALAYLGNAERRLGWRLVARMRGGHRRGGTGLTADGRDFVRRYGGFRRRLDVALRRLYASAFDGWPCA